MKIIFWQPIILAVLCTAFFACSNDTDEVDVLTKKKEIVETGKDTEIIYSEDGLVKVKIVGKTVLRHVVEEPYIEFVDGVNMFFYTADFKVESKLSANYAIKYDDKKEMTVREDVVVHNVKGERLNTEELIWDEDAGKIWSDKFVKITTPDEVIFGDGFESNLDFSDYKIMKIRGIMKVDEGEML